MTAALHELDECVCLLGALSSILSDSARARGGRSATILLVLKGIGKGS